MRISFSLILFLTTFIAVHPGHAQTGADTLTTTDADELELDLISLDKKKEEPKKAKVKAKKNEFWGIRAKKGFVKVGSGTRQTIEIFYYLREYTEPNPYIRTIHWYDLKKKQLSQSFNFDKANTRLLHGPYKKYVGGKIVEEGYYYKGTKHGRWEQYDANFMLVNKIKYYRGWPKESKIVYYDAQKTKLKEVIPIEFGVKKGAYYSFYEEGQLAEEGQYDNGIKVGKWTEYYQYRRRKKREVQYAPDGFTKDFEPIVIKEWDEQGKLILDREEEAKGNLSKF